MSSPAILYLECSTKLCAVGVSQGETMLAARQEWAEEYRHSETLHSFIRNVLDQADLNTSDLQAVCVSQGPGSYTGLRIAYGTAKGLCYALGIPLIAVPTLDAVADLALRNHDQAQRAVATIDARRDEVYMVNKSRGEGMVAAEAVILDEDTLSEFAGEEVVFCGEAARKCKDLVTSWSGSWRLSEQSLLGVEALVRPALAKLENGEHEDLAYCEPFYLKEFQPGKKKAK